MQKHHLWQATLERLRMSIDPDIFRLWFQETTALSWHEGVFVVGVPTTFTRVHLEVRYLDQIRTAVSDVVGTPVRVHLEVSQRQPLRSDVFLSQSDEEQHENNTMAFLVVIAKESFGYQASVPDVAGCVAVGKTRQEAVQEVQVALQAYLEMRQNDNTPVPEPQTTAEYIRLPLSSNQVQGSNHTLHDDESLLLSASHCSFCQRQQDPVYLTSGPGGFFICHECVTYCREMIEEGTVDFQHIKLALASRQRGMIQ